MTEKKYIGEIVEVCENGDSILQLPPELCEDMGWTDGTVLKIELENGCIILTEKKDKDASST